MNSSIRIDIVSDIMCPWCIIGFKRFQKSMDRFNERVGINIHWHPFELNPDMPPEGQNLYEWLNERYGMSHQEILASRKDLTQLGNELGFTFNYQSDMRMYNTFNAHQLLHWAGECSIKQTELKLALFSTHFTFHKNISDPAILLEVVNQIGLDEVEAKRILEEGRYRQPVRNDQNRWKEMRVQSVPHFVFNEKSPIAGAQSPEIFEIAIKQHATP